MIDCNIDCVADYFENAKYNYVIMQNGQPVHWIEEDGDAPIIYGDKEDYENELKYNLDGYNEDGTLKDEFEVMTEWDFLMNYCLFAIEDFIKNYVLKNGEFDGINHIHYMNNPNGYKYIDVLGVYANKDNLSFLVSEDNDNKQYFLVLSDFNDDEILKIIEDVFDGVN